MKSDTREEKGYRKHEEFYFYLTELSDELLAVLP